MSRYAIELPDDEAPARAVVVRPAPTVADIADRFTAGPARTPTSAEQAAAAWLVGHVDSVNTARSYAAVIRGWFAVCAGRGVDPLLVVRADIDVWKESLYDGGASPATVYQRLSVLASFYAYCFEEEWIRRNPMRGVRRPRLVAMPKSTGLTRDELRDLIRAAERTHPMLHLLVLLLGLNGLRASEPLRARVEDIGTARGHHIVRVARKGSPELVPVPLAPPTMAALERWLELRSRLLGQLGRGTGYLFLRFARGGRWRPGLALPPLSGDLTNPPDHRDVHRWIRRLGRDALPHKTGLHPHDLRHAFVTLSLDAGVPLRDVQDSAGHASANTTRRYDRSRGNIDRAATYTLATYLGGGT